MSTAKSKIKADGGASAAAGSAGVPEVKDPIKEGLEFMAEGERKNETFRLGAGAAPTGND